jgi:two-component system sensor histidine kinase/response regulator
MKQTLLIADGDAELCGVYEQFFTERGYEVETSSDGLDCLRKLCQVPPDVLVLDLDLRWGGGDGVLAWLREESPAPGMPVLLTATADYPQDSAQFIEPPVVEFLSKPFALTALLESVRSAVAKKGPEEPSNLNCASCYSELFIG